jgi:hypothetical protein
MEIVYTDRITTPTKEFARAERFKKVENATALIWKMLQVTESTFRRLRGAKLLPAVYAGVQYEEGVQRITSRQQNIAA